MSHHRGEIRDGWLYDEERDRFVDGDLFLYEGMHVFVAAIVRRYEADWQLKTDPRRTADGDPEPSIIIPRGATYFERRGTIVFKEGVLTLEGQRLIREQE